MEPLRDVASGTSPTHASGTLSSPILVTAGLCVAILIAVLLSGFSRDSGEQFSRSLPIAESAHVTNGEADLAALGASDSGIATSDIAMVGPSVVGALVAQYQQLKDSGTYTPEAANSAADQLAARIIVPVPYKRYALSGIVTSTDTSYQGMLAYRGKLKNALTPLTSVSDLEIAVFAKYAETKDPVYLDQLRAIIADYADATQAAAALTVPSDAAIFHVGILNAMGQFGATLQALVDNADDPITTVTLLRSYNDAENGMISSFNALAQYYAHHSRS